MNEPTAATPGPDPIDLHVGGAIRTRRRFLRKSQTELGQQLGVTFQQVQKYERGVNRVSGSTLYRIADALCADVGSFFPPRNAEAGEDALDRTLSQLARTKGGLEVARAFPDLPPQAQRAVADLVTTLAAGAA